MLFLPMIHFNSFYCMDLSAENLLHASDYFNEHFFVVGSDKVLVLSLFLMFRKAYETEEFNLKNAAVYTWLKNLELLEAVLL